MSDIFNFKKTTNAKYIIDRQLIEFEHLPIGVYPNIEKYPSAKKVKCPSVGSVDKTLYYVNSPLTFEIEFGLRDNEPYYRYIFDDTETQDNEFVSAWLKKTLAIQRTGDIVDLQLILPYAFITDDKNLFVQTLPPFNIMHENCYYVTGGLKPSNWIRNLNSAWVVTDNNKPARIGFDSKLPCMLYHFNNPVNLEYTEKTNDINNYLEQNRYLTAYKLKQKKLIESITSRRPKKLL